MYTLYFKHLTDDEKNRTKKLLYNVRHKYDIDTYLHTKKMLLVSLIIHYYQTETRKGPWISYHQILTRYERRYEKHYSKTEYCNFGQIYFGFRKNTILESNLSTLENVVNERCMGELGIPN